MYAQMFERAPHVSDEIQEARTRFATIQKIGETTVRWGDRRMIVEVQAKGSRVRWELFQE